MSAIAIPKLVATSVVRGSEKGQSHGGVYTIDFSVPEVTQHIDWNTSNIDFSGRGWDRGLRGIEIDQEDVFIAASDELFCYSPTFELQASYRNRYLKHCHEICKKDNYLFLTSTGFDSLLVFDLLARQFTWGLFTIRDGQKWQGQQFDPRSAGGPPPSNNYHINMVHVNQQGIYFSGLNTKAVLKVDGQMNVSEISNLPVGAHNARPFKNGLLFNDTQSDAVRYVGRDGEQCTFGVPRYKDNELDFVGVDDSRVARQAFGRGLCVINESLLAAGSSPSTISVYDLNSAERVAAVNISMDVRNAIHGLEVWPFS